MQAQDVMTRHLITASPHDTVGQVAQRMMDHGISGMPVVDELGRAIGMISESDLLRRPELGTEKHQSGWLRFFTPEAELAADYAKTHALRVEDVMTTPVIAVAPTASLGDVVTLMERQGVRRVAVLDDERLVGMVSRSNLVQALTALAGPGTDSGLNDRRIRDQILAEFKRLDFGMSNESNVVVHDGIVHLWGLLDTPDAQRALRVAAEGVEGVRRVVDHSILIHGGSAQFSALPIL